MDEIIAKILAVSKTEDQSAILQLEPLIEQVLQKNPHNTEMNIRLAMLLREMPFVDKFKSVVVLGKVLEYEPHNGLVMILRAYLYYWATGIIEKPWCEQLSSLTAADNELNSMMRYTASLFFTTDGNEDDIEREKLLTESINFWQGHVRNYKDLAELYLKQSKLEKAEELFRTALNNVTHVYREIKSYPDPDITEHHRFLCEFIKGIYLTDTTLWIMKKKYAEASLRNKLTKDPRNIKTLLDLASVKSSNCDELLVLIKEVLTYSPNNPIALLILAYRNYLHNKFDETLVYQLISIKTDNQEINSMLLYAASWFYAKIDEKKEEELLLQSIKEYPYHVMNYYALSQLYAKQNKSSEAKKLKQKAFNNVARVLCISESDEILVNTENFINQAVKGIWLSEPAYESLYKEVSEPTQ